MAKNLTLPEMRSLAKDPIALSERLKEVKSENELLKPYIYYQSIMCHTCKSRDRKMHPVTGYCWHCDTDNF